ncbi:MAG: NAD kinase [Jiangellales bacterium]
MSTDSVPVTPAVAGEHREVLVVPHVHRQGARAAAATTARLLVEAGIEVRVPEGDVHVFEGLPVHPVPDASAAAGTELVVVLGGDGTILRGIEMARSAGVPLLGVNLGHVGFLAEAESDGLADTVQRVVDRRYTVEERMTIDVDVRHDGELVQRQWALNEASVEKTARQKMLELVVEIDGRPLSRWGGDGVVFATPTGSTAYAFSAGGPVVWPQVEALLLVPLSAHALFARPLVVAPTSMMAVDVVSRAGALWCDGRRTFDLPPGARIEVRRGSEPVRFARLHSAPFTDRLVAKFALPVEGWRGPVGETD